MSSLLNLLELLSLNIKLRATEFQITTNKDGALELSPCVFCHAKFVVTVRLYFFSLERAFWFRLLISNVCLTDANMKVYLETLGLLC